MKEFISDSLKAILSFGPRAVGTPAEKACAEFLAETFQKQNLNVVRQEITASKFTLFLAGKIFPAVSLVTLCTVGCFFFHRPAVSFILLLLPPGLLVIISRNIFTRFTKIFDLGKPHATCNIIARTGPGNPAAPTLVFVAHYDTKSLSQPSKQRFLCVLIPLVLYGLLALLSLLTLLHLILLPKPVVLILILAAIFCHLRYMLSTTANLSPGAMDNASGVAILLALSRLLPARLAEKNNLIFLASGAEELGLVGALRFLQTYRKELDPGKTTILNFDSLGVGGKILMVGPRRLIRSGVVDRARELLARQGFGFRFFSFMIGAGMDHIPFVQNGFTAMSFTQVSLESVLRLHAPSDRLEYLQIDELAVLSQLFAEFAQTL